MSTTPAIKRFEKLIEDISQMYIHAREVQVHFAWATGRRLVEEEQHGAMRAKYGKALIAHVSEELTKKYGSGFSVSNLRKMRQFYLLNQKHSVPSELDWTDYVELLPIRDDKTRKRLEQRIIKEDLTSEEVRELVQKIRKAPATKSPSKLPSLKCPTDLNLHTFCKSKLPSKLKDNEVLIDCGFTVNWRVQQEELKYLTITDTPSYTYEAAIHRVVDGDTLVVIIELGFGGTVNDKLRLRGIDCPEVGTPEGDAAKAYVEKLLPVGSTIVVKSHKSRVDSHGRFVVDVLFREGAADPEEIIKDPVYLNQHLIDEGHAVRMAE